jgi:hypothetical protein
MVVVTQCTGSGGGMEGNYQWVTRWGEHRPLCTPCASLIGEKEKGGDRVRSTRRRASDGAYKKRKEGGPVWGRGRKSRADKGARKRGCTVQEDKVSVAPRCGHTSVAHMGPTTDGVRRTRSDSDPTCVAWPNRSQGRCPVRRSNYSKLLEG